MTRCPWCPHTDGCPYLDRVGNLLTPDVECPDVCGQPTTHVLVLPFGTIQLCRDHFRAAMSAVTW